MNAKALSIMRYQDNTNTEHNMKSICRAAVAQIFMHARQCAWLALDKREFENGKAQIFFYYILNKS